MSAVKSSVKFSSPITVFVAGDSMREQDAELSPTSRCVQGKARDAEARNTAKVHILVRQTEGRPIAKEEISYAMMLVKELVAHTQESLDQAEAGI